MIQNGDRVRIADPGRVRTGTVVGFDQFKVRVLLDHSGCTIIRDEDDLEEIN